MKSIVKSLMAVSLLLSTLILNAQTKLVFENYFSLKDALVKTDGKLAATFAGDLTKSINAVNLESLSKESNVAFVKLKKDLVFDAEHISGTENVGHQRDHFMSLSTNMYELIKVSKSETAVYYQSCPMANKGRGAKWLSKENAVKNPYYGNKMLSCGRTVETIK